MCAVYNIPPHRVYGLQREKPHLSYEWRVIVKNPINSIVNQNTEYEQRSRISKCRTVCDQTQVISQ